MQKVSVGQEALHTPSSGPGVVVCLSDYRRVSHRLARLLKRRKSSCIWAAIGVTLLSAMTFGAISDGALLKVIAWLAFGITFLLVTPFSGWLNSTSRR